MDRPSASHGKDEDGSSQLRQALKDQIRHPYITDQGLDSDPDEGPDSDPEKRTADGASRSDDETPGQAADPPPLPAAGDESSEGGVETS